MLMMILRWYDDDMTSWLPVYTPTHHNHVINRTRKNVHNIKCTRKNAHKIKCTRKNAHKHVLKKSLTKKSKTSKYSWIILIPWKTNLERVNDVKELKEGISIILWRTCNAMKNINFIYLQLIWSLKLMYSFLNYKVSGLESQVLSFKSWVSCFGSHNLHLCLFKVKIT